MAEQFSNWGIDVKIGSNWTALKSDVLQSPGPRWGRGALDNGPLDRVGSNTTLVFYLRNDNLNSARLAGYYSPGHANALSGWRGGLSVRMWFSYDGYTRYKFYGTIPKDGIKIDAGIYARRTVMITAENFMAEASDHELNLLSLATNKRIEEVVALILANMGRQPLNTEYATGADTFPTVFDTVGPGTRAVSEFNKIALSEFGYIYDKGNETDGETLVVESRNTRSNVQNTNIPMSKADSGHLLLEDGGGLLLEDGGYLILNETQQATLDNLEYPDAMQTSYGKHLANRIKGISYPRRVDAAATTVLFTLQKAIQLAAGESTTIRGQYRDPSGGASYVNGKEMVTPTATTDYTANANEDGSGADRTANLTVTAIFGTSDVEFQLTASAALWVTKLQCRGKGIYLYDPVTSLFQDAASQADYGVRPLDFDQAYQDDPTVTQDLANYTLGMEKDPHITVDRYPILANRNSLTMMAFMFLEPGTRATFKEDQVGVNGDYFIMGYEAEMFAGQYVIWSPVLKDASSNAFWIWDTSKWDVDTVWSF